jgi:hypothetical protein
MILAIIATLVISDWTFSDYLVKADSAKKGGACFPCLLRIVIPTAGRNLLSAGDQQKCGFLAWLDVYGLSNSGELQLAVRFISGQTHEVFGRDEAKLRPYGEVQENGEVTLSPNDRPSLSFNELDSVLPVIFISIRYILTLAGLGGSWLRFASLDDLWVPEGAAVDPTASWARTRASW